MTKQSALAVNALALLPAHIKADFVQNEAFNEHCFTDGEVSLTVSGDEYHFYVAVKTIHRKESLSSLPPFIRESTSEFPILTAISHDGSNIVVTTLDDLKTLLTLPTRILPAYTTVSPGSMPKSSPPAIAISPLLLNG